jgi:hypothetical protein
LASIGGLRIVEATGDDGETARPAAHLLPIVTTSAGNGAVNGLDGVAAL